MATFEKIKFRGKTEEYFIHRMGRPRFNEIDHYGVMWNGHYVNYFETARLAMCKEFGFDMELLSNLGFFLPVYKYEITMTKPVFPQDEITIAVKAVELEESNMKFVHLLMVNGEVRASGSVQHIALSKETGAIAFALPEQIKTVLQPIKETLSV